MTSIVWFIGCLPTDLQGLNLNPYMFTLTVSSLSAGNGPEREKLYMWRKAKIAKPGLLIIRSGGQISNQ